MTRHVQEIMSAPVLTVDVSDSLWDAWQLLSVSGLRHLIVIDREGDCLGVISDRNVLAEPPLNEQHLSSKAVGSIMKAEFTHRLKPDDSAKHAASAMVDHEVEALPICSEDGKVLGIVTETDVIRSLL